MMLSTVPINYKFLNPISLDILAITNTNGRIATYNSNTANWRIIFIVNPGIPMKLLNVFGLYTLLWNRDSAIWPVVSFALLNTRNLLFVPYEASIDAYFKAYESELNWTDDIIHRTTMAIIKNPMVKNTNPTGPRNAWMFCWGRWATLSIYLFPGI